MDRLVRCATCRAAGDLGTSRRYVDPVSNHLDARAALAEARETVRRPDFRRAIGCGIVALAAPGVYYGVGGVQAPDGQRIGAYAAIAACLLFGLVAVRSTANEVARLVGRNGVRRRPTCCAG